MNQTSTVIQLKRESIDAQGVFTAYASVFGNIDSDGDVITRGAFRHALITHKNNETLPAMLWSHNQSEPIGKWLHFEEDDYGLLATGKLTLGTTKGSEAHALLKDDALGFSVGFITASNGSKIIGGVRHITKIARLHEVSLVSLPSPIRARLTDKKPTTRKEFEHLLRKAAGLSVNEAKRVSFGGWGNLVRQEQDSKDFDRIYNAIDELRTEILNNKE